MPATPAEGELDFATGAEDVEHIPLPEDEGAIDATEGADLLPVEGEDEKPPTGTAGDRPAHGRTRSIPAP